MAKASGSVRARVKVADGTNDFTIGDSIANIVSSLNATAIKASEIIRKIGQDIQEKGHSEVQPFKIGVFSKQLSDALLENGGIKLQSRELFSSVKALRHHHGGQKAAKGKELMWEEKEEIPVLINTMDVYEHGGNIVLTNYKIKVIVRPNQEISISRRRKIVANHISASRVLDHTEFNNPQYQPLVKKIKR